MLGLMNIWAATSALVPPWATRCATRASWGVRRSVESTDLLRVVPQLPPIRSCPFSVTLASKLREESVGGASVREHRLGGSRGATTRQREGGCGQGRAQCRGNQPIDGATVERLGTWPFAEQSTTSILDSIRPRRTTRAGALRQPFESRCGSLVRPVRLPASINSTVAQGQNHSS